jgi:hypothetical protein
MSMHDDAEDLNRTSEALLAKIRVVGDQVAEVIEAAKVFAASPRDGLADLERGRPLLRDLKTLAESLATLAEPRGMRPLVAHCHLGLGKLYLRTDKREQAQEHLATATTMYREMGMTYWLEKAEAEMTKPGG